MQDLTAHLYSDPVTRLLEDSWKGTRRGGIFGEKTKTEGIGFKLR